MTTVGKILVIVIMVFAVVFLGISTVVYSTATDWKNRTAVEKKKADELGKKNSDLAAQVTIANNERSKALADQKAAVAQSEARIKSLEDEIKTLNNEATAARAKLETAQASANTALTLAEERLKETTQLREQKSAVEKQANDFKLRQTELIDKIRDLERLTKTLNANNADLKDRVARFSTALRKAGLSDDVSTYKGLESPPPVEGEVARVDPRDNRRIELTIGADDGLVVGHELNMYRLKPRPEYLGRVRVQAVDPDHAVARVISNVQGKKIQEGDIVSSTIRPRS